jgi:hypothetical protein
MTDEAQPEKWLVLHAELVDRRSYQRWVVVRLSFDYTHGNGTAGKIGLRRESDGAEQELPIEEIRAHFGPPPNRFEREIL